ncbi:integrase core domain-containing protein [Streptomyces albidochromogenes]|uniref:Integrase core domain-containing protein n=1 Tax=Streptomyces albidochromogenes TaxID=329524 RepID=A0ABW6FHN1_9ACTN
MSVSTPVNNSPPWQRSPASPCPSVAPGSAGTNALAKSFLATTERELLDTSPWPSRAAALTAIFDFIEGWYNLHRLHRSLGYRSPAEYESPLAA